MKLHTLLFSPTGTSAKIARAVANGILRIDNTLEESLLDGTRKPVSSTFSPNDLVVMAAPVYGGHMAPLAKERFRQVSARQTPCVLLAVYGNRAFENALNDMAGFARSIGFVPIAAGAFIGEHSYSGPTTPIAAGRPDAADLNTAEAFGKAIAQKIKSGNLSSIDPAPLLDEAVPEASLRNFLAFVQNYRQEQKASPKQYLPVVDAQLCTGCGTCAESCPTAAISRDGSQTEAAKCIKCCACVKVCPAGARSFHSPFAAVLSENFNTRKSPRYLCETAAMKLNPELTGYVESHIIPRYASFDKAHREDHARMVIRQSMQIAERMPEANPDMVYVVAAFHDLGLVNGRENHHIDSRKILLADAFLQKHFSESELQQMGDAVADHRASNRHRPRNIYGLIVAEADRFIDPETIIRRTVQYGLANYPELDPEGHYRRTLNHLAEKYGPDGYLKIWIPWSENAGRLKELHRIMADGTQLRSLFNRIFEEETGKGKS